MTVPSEQQSAPGQIWDAIGQGDLASLERLFVAHPSEVNGYTFFAGGTYLHYAAAHAPSSDVLALLIRLGFDVNKPGKLDGDTALVAACAQGQLENVRFLIEAGSILDVSEPTRNPLFACVSGYQPHWDPAREPFLDIARALIAGGINAKAIYTGPNMVDMDAMAFATMWGRKDIAELIAENLHGDDSLAKAAALTEAEIVAEGNAHRREAFRRERYPCRRR